MKVGEICNRETVIARPHESLLEAAKRMREYHVGTLVVVREEGGRRIPIGIITDRDILIEVVAEGVSAEKISIEDVMAPEPVIVKETEGIFETIDLMRQHGIRRILVVDERKTLIGILAMDDLMEFLSEELEKLSKVFYFQKKQETLNRPAKEKE